MKTAVWSALVFFAAFGTILLSPNSNERRQIADESGFAAVAAPLLSLYFEDLFDDGYFSKKEWLESFLNYGRENPRIGVFILGANTRLTSMFAVPDHSLWMVMAVFSSGCVGVVFTLAARYGSVINGLLAALLLMVNPIFFSARTAFTPDMPMLFFVLLSVLMMIKITDRLATGIWPWATVALFGLLVGMSIGCKVFAVFLLPVFALLTLPAARRGLGRWFLANTLAAAVALALFYVSNPLLYMDLGGGLRALTVGHIGNHGGTPAWNPLGWKNLHSALLFLSGYRVYSDWAFMPLSGPASTALADAHPYSPWFGYFLAAGGVLALILKRRPLPLLAAALSFLTVAFVVSSMPATWAVPKNLLLPLPFVIWIESLAVPRSAASIFPARIRKALLLDRPIAAGA